MVLIAAIVINLKKLSSTNGTQTEALTALKFEQHLAIFILSTVIGYAIANIIKDAATMVRPYCTDTYVMNDLVKSICKEYDPARCKASFPSGHSTYICFIVFSFWKLLNRFFKFVGVALIILTGLSRVGLGMHYFSDVIYGYIFAAFICAYAHHIVMNSSYSPIRQRIFEAVRRLFVENGNKAKRK
jgi:membrane-associated phospholipid phosphatase